MIDNRYISMVKASHEITDDGILDDSCTEARSSNNTRQLKNLIKYTKYIMPNNIPLQEKRRGGGGSFATVIHIHIQYLE